jgi:hydrogenase expression/formation protein HypC
MCMGLPGRVVEAADLARQVMVVDVRGQRQKVSAAMLIGDGMNTLKQGDWVLVHMGFALSRMDEAEALSTLASLDELSGMYAEFELSAASADSAETMHSAR